MSNRDSDLLEESERPSYAEVKRGIPQSNRGAVWTAFSWADFDRAKAKYTTLRKLDVNPLSKASTSWLVDQLRPEAAIERFERALDRVTARESERVADALVGPPVDSHVSRAYCRCGCGSELPAVTAALQQVANGVAPRDAVTNIAMAYGLDEGAQDTVLDEVNEELDRTWRCAP